MSKLNIPLGEDGGKDYSAEIVQLNKLTTDAMRTITGTTTFTSESSGITYSTDDYPDDPEIYDKGDLGMIYLLRKLYGGENGWIVMADDLNNKQPSIVYVSFLLLAENWQGEEQLYTQLISSDAIASSTKIDLYPNEAVFAQLSADGVSALFAKNENGVATAVCIGNKPTADFSIGAQLTEVKVIE